MRENKTKSKIRRLCAIVLAMATLLSCAWIGASAGSDPITHTVTYDGNEVKFVVKVDTSDLDVEELTLTPTFAGGATITAPTPTGVDSGWLESDGVVKIPVESVDGTTYTITYTFDRAMSVGAVGFAYDGATGVFIGGGSSPDFEIDAEFVLTGTALSTAKTSASFNHLADLAATYKGKEKIEFKADADVAEYTARFEFSAGAVDGQFVAIALDLSGFGPSVLDEVDARIAAGPINTNWYLVNVGSGKYVAYALSEKLLKDGAAGLSAYFELELFVRKAEVHSDIDFPLGEGTIEVTHPPVLDATKSGELEKITYEDDGTGTNKHYAYIEWTIFANTGKQELDVGNLTIEEPRAADTLTDVVVTDSEGGTYSMLTTFADAGDGESAILTIPLTVANKSAMFTIKFTERRELSTTDADKYINGTSTLELKNTATVTANIKGEPSTSKPTGTVKVPPLVFDKVATTGVATRAYDPAAKTMTMHYTITYTPQFDMPFTTFVLKDVVTFPTTGGFTGTYAVSDITCDIDGTSISATATPASSIGADGFGFSFSGGASMLKKGETLTLKYTIVISDVTSADMATAMRIVNTATDTINATDVHTSWAVDGVTPGDSNALTKYNTSVSYDRLATWRIDLNRNGTEAIGTYTFYEVLPVGFDLVKTGTLTSATIGTTFIDSGATGTTLTIYGEGGTTVPDDPADYPTQYVLIETATIADVDGWADSYGYEINSDSKVYKIKVVSGSTAAADRITIRLRTFYNPDEIGEYIKAPNTTPNRQNYAFNATDKTQSHYTIDNHILKDMEKYNSTVTMNDDADATITWRGYINLMGKSMKNAEFTDVLQQGTYGTDETPPDGVGVQTVDFTSVKVWKYVGAKNSDLSITSSSTPEPTAAKLANDELWELLTADTEYTIDTTDPGTLTVKFADEYDSNAIHFISFDSKLTGGVMDKYTNTFMFNGSTSNTATATSKPSTFVEKTGKFISSDTIEYAVIFNKDRVEQSGEVKIDDNLGGGKLTYVADSAELYTAKWDASAGEYVKGTKVDIALAVTAGATLEVKIPWSTGNKSEKIAYMLVYAANPKPGTNSTITNTAKVSTTYHNYENNNILAMTYKVGANGGITSHSTYVVFVKVDTNGNPLKGAEFTISRNSGTAIPAAKSIATSDENGIVLFEDLGVGTYTIKETKTPNNYKTAADTTLTVSYTAGVGDAIGTWNFVVDGDGKVSADTAKDKLDESKISNITLVTTDSKGDAIVIPAEDVFKDIVFGIENEKKPTTPFIDDPKTPDDPKTDDEDPKDDDPTDDPTDPTDDPTTPIDPTDPSDDPTTSDTPDTPDTSETPERPEPKAPETYLPDDYIPLGTISLVEYEDGYVIFDDDTPLGFLTWDDELEEWVFDEDVPLGFFTPRTGDNARIALYALTTLASAAAIIVITTKRKKFVK